MKKEVLDETRLKVVPEDTITRVSSIDTVDDRALNLLFF